MKRMIPTWFFYALSSFLCFGITNSLLGAIFEWSSRNPAVSISAPFILWTAMGATGLVASGIFRISRRGFKGLPAKRFAWIAAIAGVTLSLGMLTLKLGLASDPLAKGPIVAITSCNAMLVALAAWLLLHEKLSTLQILAMITISGAIAVMALGGGSETNLRGFFFGLATMTLFGITNFLLKYAGHFGCDSITTTVVLWLASGACGILALAYSFLRHGNLPGLKQTELIVWAIVAGVSLALGMLFIKLAVTQGPAGPATAITGSNSVLVAAFEYFIFGHIPPTAKLIAMSVTLFGIIVLTLGGKNVPIRKQTN